MNLSDRLTNTLSIYIIILTTVILLLEETSNFILAFKIVQPGDIMLNK